MADSAIAITAGTGTNVDTRTEGTSGNHRQVIVIGDPATNAGVAPVDVTAGLKVDLGADNDVTVTGTVTVGSHAVTNAGTFAVQVDGAALTALQVIDNPVLVDDAAFTPATSSVMMAGFEFDDSSPDSVNEGDAGAARMSANRNIYMTIRDAAGNERGLNVDASGLIGTTSADLIAATAGQAIDAALTSNPVVTGLRASFSRPTAVSADGDVQAAWGTRSGATVIAAMGAAEYEPVAAGQTAQVIGPTGATGDYLSHVIVSPATASCGVVTILDNATALVSFPGGGTTALSNLIPFVIPVGIISSSGAWKITTGSNVSCVAVGKFT
jgi:hypothetical protein